MQRRRYQCRGWRWLTAARRARFGGRRFLPSRSAAPSTAAAAGRSSPASSAPLLLRPLAARSTTPSMHVSDPPLGPTRVLLARTPPPALLLLLLLSSSSSSSPLLLLPLLLLLLLLLSSSFSSPLLLLLSSSSSCSPPPPPALLLLLLPSPPPPPPPPAPPLPKAFLAANSYRISVLHTSAEACVHVASYCYGVSPTFSFVCIWRSVCVDTALTNCNVDRGRRQQQDGRQADGCHPARAPRLTPAGAGVRA
eukprot:COSAG05_NODE_1596_length_4455_cov_3.362259_2_plen_251_part_00